MSDKKVIIQGKEYDYGNMSDEDVIELFSQIKKKELSIYKKIVETKLKIKAKNN